MPTPQRTPLTEGAIQKILQRLKQRQDLTSACRAENIARTTWYDWLHRSPAHAHRGRLAELDRKPIINTLGALAEACRMSPAQRDLLAKFLLDYDRC